MLTRPVTPRSFATKKRSIKPERVDTPPVGSAKEQVKRELEQKARRRMQLDYLLMVIADLFPRTKTLTKILRRRNMPKNDAKQFMAEFAKAEGFRKWILLAGALSTFALLYFAPEHAIIPPAVVFGVDAFISKWEQESAE